MTSEHKLNSVLGFSSCRSNDSQVVWTHLVFMKIKIENCLGLVRRVTNLAPVLSCAHHFLLCRSLKQRDPEPSCGENSAMLSHICILFLCENKLRISTVVFPPGCRNSG